MTLLIQWPQVIVVVLALLNLGISIAHHGKTKEVTFNGWHRLATVIIWGTLLWFGGFFKEAHAQTTPSIPSAAAKHRADLTRTAHSQWGLDAPVATFAAQLHQESGWQTQALSRVGAAGMAQFMPTTARWWCQINGLSDADCQPNNPTWALRALVGYNKWLHDRVAAADGCNRMAFVLSAYNGGLGWVQRDKALAKNNRLNPAIWFDQVERVNAGRSAANWRENRDYPRRILHRLEPVYKAAGWGRGACP